MKLNYHIFKSIANGFFGMFIGRRAVLIVDVRRPLPLAADLVNRLLVDVVGRHTYGRALARKAEEFASMRLARQRVAA